MLGYMMFFKGAHVTRSLVLLIAHCKDLN